MACAPVNLSACGGTTLDLAHGRLHVRRSKGGETAVHPIGGKEMRALRRLQREARAKSVYVLISERGAPLSVAGYQRMVARAGVAARFPFLIHSHMLRHSSPMTVTTRGRSRGISDTDRS
jgi:integrase